MTPNVYNPKIHNKKLLTILLVAAVAIMFLIRGILYQNGTLEDIQTLEPDELHKRISGYEVQVERTGSDGAGTRGSGTILDGRKHSTQDENYTLTIVTACHVVAAEPAEDSGASKKTGTSEPAGEEATDAGAQDGGAAESDSGTVEITLPDGSVTQGSVISEDPVQDLAFVQCECPTEIDAYYSRDILERLSEGDPVYAIKGENLISGTVVGTKMDLAGIGSNLTVVNINSEEGMSGAGIYGSSGNYLGMIVQGAEDGRTACVSAVDIMKALND